MLAEAQRNGTRLALLFFDLDEFKYINDTFGHRAGDAMLIRVAGDVAS
jgi:diguanylate cyclase (GGDEF)-like protein